MTTQRLLASRPVIVMKVHDPFVVVVAVVVVNPNLQIFGLCTDKERKTKERGGRERGNQAYNLLVNHLPMMPK